MSLIGMMEERLPPGFRFHPRDDELVLDYLCRKLSGGHGGSYGGVDMVDVDLNKCEPWELPDAARVGSREWYFFSLHDRKYATGQRINRATQSGYWKATGKDRTITGRRGAAAVVGMRKTLIFYCGRAPMGAKTEWVMHEFRGVDDRLAGHATLGLTSPSRKEDWVLCRVFYKSRTAAAPSPASDDATGSLCNDLPELLPMDPVDAYAAFGHTPSAPTMDGWHGHQDSTGQLLLAAQHRPATPLPFKSFRDLLSDVVEGCNGPRQEFPDPGWGDDGCTYAAEWHVADVEPVVSRCAMYATHGSAR